MIQVENISIAYHGTSLFANASFILRPKERLGLVGRNGSGKSTLFRMLLGKETPDTGSIIIPKGYSIGTLDQHIRFSAPTLLQEAILGLKEEERDESWRVEKILFGLGFKDEDLDRDPSEFSGGFQLRLHLAKVLASDPDCLLLDEPTNYLDILSLRWLKRFLKQWRGEFILITHDREFMDSVTNATLGIHRHQVIKAQGGTEALFAQILQAEENFERARLNLEKKKEHLQSFIERFGAKASKATQARSRQKMIDKMPVLEALKNLYNLQFAFQEAPFNSQKMLEARHVLFRYASVDPPLINDLSLTINREERIAIIGKNGYGKSTLLRLLTGELPTESGSITLSNNVHIGYFGQTHIDRLHPHHTIEEEIKTANPRLTNTEVRKIAGTMMFSGTQAEKAIQVLSGGERARVLLGKLIGKPCNLLLLDEPTHHLDMESVEALIDALEEFSGSVVVVTHSELLLERLNLTQIVICSKNEQRVFQGNYEEFLEKLGWPEEEQNSPNKPNKSAAPSFHNPSQTNLLRTIENKIATAEKEISALENHLNHSQKDLESYTPADKKFQELCLEMTHTQKKIDDLFTVLEKLYEEHEILKKR